MAYLCPTCNNETVYQVFSGGREWYCESCEDSGYYPAGEVPRRAQMLQSPEGVIALRAEMDQELARRSEAGP